jgi:hypothetical protein
VLPLPVVAELHAGELVLDGTFQPDENLGAAGLPHESQKDLILGHRQIRLGEPAEIPTFQRGE